MRWPYMRQRTHRFGAALRRQAGDTVEDVASRFRDLLHLLDRLAGEALLLRWILLRPVSRIDGRNTARARGRLLRWSGFFELVGSFSFGGAG